MFRIKKVRRDMGVTQEEIASYLNMSKRNWIRIENGEHEPKLKVADRAYSYLIAVAAKDNKDFKYNMLELFSEDS
jgi:DNA-binding XRE family transcriptional regulator|tara:strand:- start:324 stop:548 length:225 start_codon:yes stop_codon:yes gene_type:complete